MPLHILLIFPVQEPADDVDKEVLIVGLTQPATSIDSSTTVIDVQTKGVTVHGKPCAVSILYIMSSNDFITTVTRHLKLLPFW
jgi:hypothetical protein